MLIKLKSGYILNFNFSKWLTYQRGIIYLIIFMASITGIFLL